MPQTEKQTRGRIGEDAAAAFCERQGYTVVARNVREGHNEIDLIVRNDTSLVFIEVKTRTQTPSAVSRFGRPLDAVDAGKRRRTVGAAEAYIRAHPEEASGRQPRIDVIEVYLSPDGEVREIRPFRNAFGAR